MREILFKAKRLDNGEWVYGILCKGLFSAFAIEELSDMRRRDVIEKTICQYTGIRDKNGMKIFEGDIIKWDEKEWGGPFSEEVRWDYCQLDMREHDWPQFCEVVGNVNDKRV